MFLKNHTLKAGVEYEENLTDSDFSWDVGVGGFVLKLSDSLYTSFWAQVINEVRHRVPSFFVQDSWLITDRLRVNLGVRWDGQYFVGSDGKVAQSITDQFQPRAGIIYQIGKIGSQKIFGSYGRFYEQIPTLFSAQLFSEIPEFITTFDHNPIENPAGGDTLDLSIGISPRVDGLRGQYNDEFILGYERAIGTNLKFGISGIYRKVGQVVEDVLDPQKGFVFGNPGKGDLDAFPEFTRNYMALVLTLERFGSRRFNFLASYLLSRNHGNYAGLFNPEISLAFPNQTRSLDLLEQIPNSTGLLPNDRTHVFKFNGSYRFDFGLTMGTVFIWQSGTALTEFGGTSFGAPFFSFISQRGSAGRTPAIWDLNLRFSYDVGSFFRSGSKTSLLLDVFHLASQRKAVTVDQTHFFALDANGNQAGENPNYLRPTAFQLPMTVRLGLEIGF